MQKIIDVMLINILVNLKILIIWIKFRSFAHKVEVSGGELTRQVTELKASCSSDISGNIW